MGEVSLERRAMVRAGNQRIVETAEQLGFVGRIPLLCECGDRGCKGFGRTEAYAFRLVATQPTWAITGDAHGARFAVIDAATGEELVREDE